MVVIGYTDLEWTGYLDNYGHEAHQLTQVGSATVSLNKTSFPDSKHANKSCKIERLEVETGEILTKMEASIMMLRRLKSFGVEHNAECLTVAITLGSCWFHGLFEPPGFKICGCNRVGMHGFHLCMALETPPIESSARRRNAIDSTVATTVAEIRANAMASEKRKDRMPVVASRSRLAHTPLPSEQSGRQPEQESEAAVESRALRNPAPPQHQGTTLSRLASQEATDTDGMTAQGLTDDAAKKATASGTIPIRSRPAAKTTNHKEYCSYWIHKGECDYTQIGCKYKHEMPVDEETLLNCGFRKVPDWFKESPMYEEHLQKTGEAATGRLAGVSAEEKVTSTARPSRHRSGRRGKNVIRSQGAGSTSIMPTPSRDARQLVSHHVRSPYDNYNQSNVHPQPDTKSARTGPPSAANSNATDRAAVQQFETQTYKPLGTMASSSDLGKGGAAEGSSKVKDEDAEKPAKRARNNGGSSIAAGTPALRLLQQALQGPRPAAKPAGSMMGAKTKRQNSRPEPDADDQGAR